MGHSTGDNKNRGAIPWGRSTQQKSSPESSAGSQGRAASSDGDNEQDTNQDWEAMAGGDSNASGRSVRAQSDGYDDDRGTAPNDGALKGGTQSKNEDYDDENDDAYRNRASRAMSRGYDEGYDAGYAAGHAAAQAANGRPTNGSSRGKGKSDEKSPGQQR